MDFPEGSNMKAPRGVNISLEPFFFGLVELSLLRKPGISFHGLHNSDFIAKTHSANETVSKNGRVKWIN